jgi:spermidine/putrescine transport system ATP-binding protein
VAFHSFTCPAAAVVQSGKGHLSVRPERISLCVPGSGDLDATVEGQVYLGTDIHLQVRLADSEKMTVRLQNSETTAVPDTGAVVGLKLEAGAARLLAD